MEFDFLGRSSSGEMVELRFHRVRLAAVCAAWIFVPLYLISLYFTDFDFSVTWIVLVISVLFGASSAFEKSGGFVSSYDESGVYTRIFGFRKKYACEDITKVSKWSFPPVWVIRAERLGMVILPVGWLLQDEAALAGLEEKLREVHGGSPMSPGGAASEVRHGRE